LITVALSALGIFLFLAIYGGFRFFLTLVPPGIGLREMVYELFYFLFLFLLAGSVPFVASTLLHSADYELLSAAPIRPRTVVAAKILDATVANSLQFSIIGLPAIVACAAALSLPAGGWLLVPFLVGLFTLFPVLLTSLLLLGALSLFGARKVRRAITFVNAVMAAAVCLTIASQTGRMQLHTGFRGGLEMAARQFTPSNHNEPSTPFASALIKLGTADIAGGAGSLILLALVILGLYLLVVAWGERHLTAANLSQELEAESGSKVAAVRQDGARKGVYALLSPGVSAIIAKDLRYVLRDSVLVSQLGMPTILFFIPIMLSIQHLGYRSVQSASEVYPFAAAMTGVIVFMQTSIISLSSIGLEGRGFWITLTSPNTGRTILWAKFFMSTAISAGICSTLIAISALIFRAPLATGLLHMGIVAAVAAGLCGLGVGISASFPRFVYENPAHRVSTWALILGFLCSVAYLTVAGVFLLVAWSGLGLPDSRIANIVGGAAFLVVTAAAIFIPIALGSRRVDVYQWEH
jgi:hypothetical protein